MYRVAGIAFLNLLLQFTPRAQLLCFRSDSAARESLVVAAKKTVDTLSTAKDQASSPAEDPVH